MSQGKQALCSQPTPVAAPSVPQSAQLTVSLCGWCVISDGSRTHWCRQVLLPAGVSDGVLSKEASAGMVMHACNLALVRSSLVT